MIREKGHGVAGPGGGGDGRGGLSDKPGAGAEARVPRWHIVSRGARARAWIGEAARGPLRQSPRPSVAQGLLLAGRAVGVSDQTHPLDTPRRVDTGAGTYRAAQSVKPRVARNMKKTPAGVHLPCDMRNWLN